MTRVCATAMTALLAVVPLASCGDARPATGGPDAPTGLTAPTGPATPPPSPAPRSASPVAPREVPPRPDLLWTSATVRQGSANEEPQLCLGGVAQSYPPQCGGPPIAGWDWDDVTGETVASGVTWIDTVHVVGTYAAGVFTLQRRPSATRPVDAGAEPGPTGDPFPELCDDPLRGAAESARKGARADDAAKDALGRHLEAMPGYVASWVSDGSAFMNVVVTGDPASAHADARRLWSGKLCVQQRDVATQADMLAAQQALEPLTRDRSGCLGSSPGSDGRLTVSVTVADRETVAAVRRAVAPWLSADDVVITARLRPLDR